MVLKKYTGGGHKSATEPRKIYREYCEGEDYNRSIDLYRTVEENNNFYNGKQWEGVNAPHLDKPVDNILKPTINYYIAQIVSDDVAADVQLENYDADTAEQAANILQQEIENTIEFTNMASKNRQLLKNEAVDGDMVLYSYFDINVDSGVSNNPGAIQTEIFSNTNIIFGNPIEQDIQKQPYIILKQRVLLDKAIEMAEEAGCPIDGIVADEDDIQMFAERNHGKKYVTVYNKFWKENKQVWITRVTKSAVIKPPVNLEYLVYPVSYCSWERVKDSYHGASPLTAAIPNQILINKMLAAASAYNLNYAFPKILYDKAKLPQGWNNDPTIAVACNGDPTQAIFTTFKPADMSEQVVALITKVVEDTKNMLGVYDAALGNVNPNNTSAIVATQKAASAPLDLQKLDFYQFIEDTVRIWIEIMVADYGIRPVYVTQIADGQEVRQSVNFDFSQLAGVRYKLHIDVGASSYWSEITQMQTLDNMMNLQILPDTETYLELMPTGTLRHKDKVIKKIRQKEQQQMMMAQQQQQEQMALAQQKQQAEQEKQAVENAKTQADVMKKMQEIQTLTNAKDLKYAEPNEIDNIAGARPSGVDKAGVFI